jgi:hypothetical protein
MSSTMPMKHLKWTEEDSKSLKQYLKDFDSGKSDVVYVDRDNIDKALQ